MSPVIKVALELPEGVHEKPHFEGGFCLCYCTACFQTKQCVCWDCKHNDSKESNAQG